MSSSCKVSMWSLVKAMGTRIMFFRPRCTRPTGAPPQKEKSGKKKSEPYWYKFSGIQLISLHHNNYESKWNSFCGQSLLKEHKVNVTTFNSIISGRGKPWQWSHLALPYQPVRIAVAQLLHHQLHRGSHLSRVRVTSIDLLWNVQLWNSTPNVFCY